VSSDQAYLAHRDLIERVIGYVCRRQRLSGMDAEDFASTARLHLLEDDSAVLRSFRGQSSFQTYLIVVITRCFQDWRNARWGKWRPSAEARRLGPVAIRLETLIIRDGLQFHEAAEMLRTNDGVTETVAELERLAARFPARVGRSFTTESALETAPAADSDADAGLLATRAGATAQRVVAALERALAQLAPQDRLILRLRFDDELTTAEISRSLGLDQKALYRRVERVLAGLRIALEQDGLAAADVLDALNHRGLDVARWGDVPESPAGVRPFHRSADSSSEAGRAS